jgi:hypothetical protein
MNMFGTDPNATPGRASRMRESGTRAFINELRHLEVIFGRDEITGKQFFVWGRSHSRAP